MRAPTDQEIQRLVRLLEEAERLGALGDPGLHALFDAATADPGDTILHDLIAQSLAPYRVRDVLSPDPLRPYPGASSGLDAGEIELAAILESNLPWRVPLSQIPHVLVVGPTGKGKSHLVRRILVQCAGRIPLVFVTLKADEARLLVDPPVVRYAFRFEELKLSLFSPPAGSPQGSWVQLMVELLCRAWGLQFSRALLYECCDRLIASYGRYSQAQGRPVTFTPQNLLEAVKQRKSKYIDGIVAALEMLTRSTGDIFECGAGHDLRQLLFSGGCVLVLSSTHDDRVARFITDFLMEWAFAYLRERGPNDGSPQLLLGLDDSHRLLTAAAERDGLTPLSHRYLVARQAGLRFMVVSQYPADLAPAVLSQSGIVVQVGGLSNLKDVQSIGTALGIPASQWGRLHTPHRGEIVARENLGRYDRAFGGVVSPPVASGIAFGESDRLRLMRPLLNAMPWTPAVPLRVVDQAAAGAAAGAMPHRMPRQLSANGYTLARDVLDHPWDLLPARSARLGLAGRPIQAARDELEKHGLVRVHAIPAGSGRPSLLLEPLQALGAALGRPLPGTGKGGFLHAFVMKAVAESFRQRGYRNVRTEQFFGSKAIDVVAVNPAGDLAAAEITMSLSGVVDQLEKDFIVAPALVEIVVVCRSLSEVRQAQRAISTAPGLARVMSRIRVEPVAWFL